MKRASIPSEKRTEGQEEKFRRLVANAAKHAANLALKKIKADKSGWQKVVVSGDKVRQVIADAVISAVRELSASDRLILEWQKFYRENWRALGLESEPDLSNLVIPPRREGFDRLIVMAKGLTPQKLYDANRNLFLCWKWYGDKSLDEAIDFSFQTRNAQNGSYVIWIRDGVEADEELKKLSANDLAQKGIAGIQLEERLLDEYRYFKKTGKHLDTQNITLCSGSRCSVGDVPGVGWRDDEMHVYRCGPGNASDRLRSRRVVS